MQLTIEVRNVEGIQLSRDALDRAINNEPKRAVDDQVLLDIRSVLDALEVAALSKYR